MARAALGLGVRELAAASKVSIDTIARFERGDELKERTIDAIQKALEAAGVEFVTELFPFQANSRAMTLEQEAGFIRVVARSDNHLVLGIQGVGAGIAELSAAPSESTATIVSSSECEAHRRCLGQPEIATGSGPEIPWRSGRSYCWVSRRLGDFA